MESQDIRAIHKRLDRLEARNRLLACALLVLLALVGLMGFYAILNAESAPVTHKVIRAEGFYAVDDQGEALGMLGVNQKGNPVLDFLTGSADTMLTVGPMRAGEVGYSVTGYRI